MLDKCRRGQPPFAAPLGYVNEIYGLKGEKKILKDEKLFIPVQRLFKLYLTGAYSVPQLVKKYNDDWGYRTKRGAKLRANTAYTMLSNPFYAGKFRWDQKLYDGAYAPMISWEEHLEILKLLSRTSGKVNNSKVYDGEYKTLITCKHCQGIISSYAKNKTVKTTGEMKEHEFLKCMDNKKKGCKQQNMPKSVVDKQVNDILDRLEIPESFQKWLLEKLEREQKKFREAV